MNLINTFFLLCRKKNYYSIARGPFDSLTLTICFNKEPSFKEFTLAFAALKLISSKQPCIVRATSSNARLHIKKGTPLGVKVTLRKSDLAYFLNILLWHVFPSVKSFNLLQKYSAHDNHFLAFVISDIFLFSNLKPFYNLFYKLPSLKLTLSLSGLYKGSLAYAFFAERFYLLPYKAV